MIDTNENTPFEEGVNDDRRNAPTPEEKRAQRNKVIQREIWSWVRSLGVAVIAALIVRAFFFTPAVVKGSSMQDTLQNGQMMAVIKSAYWFGGPNRGDVVFCRYPGWEEDCVKRVIGLPGETVRVQDSVVYINGEPMEEPYLSRPGTGDFSEIIVAEGSYFVMGDNRGRSRDSREIGALEKGQIEGHCVAIFWPLTDLGIL